MTTNIASPSIQQSPAVISLLEAAEYLSCDFAVDVGPTLRPLIESALDEEDHQSGTREPSPADEGKTGAIRKIVSDLGWDSNSASFSRPLDPRALTSGLKASMLLDLHLLGEGSYSQVYRAHNKLTGTTVTLKKLRLDGCPEGLPATAIREISLLRALSGCPHIIQLLDVLYDRSRVYLILEHLDVDLHAHVQQLPQPLSAEFVRDTVWQVLQGIKSAHAHRVIHRDLKPQNILMNTGTGTVKIADFGLSRTCSPTPDGRRTMTREVITLLYRAPEVLLGSKKYGTAVDIWSVGCVMAELVLGKPLFAGDSEIGQLYQIFQLVGTPDEKTWPGVTALSEWQPLFPKWLAQPLEKRFTGRLCPIGIDLLLRMLQLDPDRRVTASQALAHPYFCQVPDGP